MDSEHEEIIRACAKLGRLPEEREEQEGIH